MDNIGLVIAALIFIGLIAVIIRPLRRKPNVREFNRIRLAEIGLSWLDSRAFDIDPATYLTVPDVVETVADAMDHHNRVDIIGMGILAATELFPDAIGTVQLSHLLQGRSILDTWDAEHALLGLFNPQDIVNMETAFGGFQSLFQGHEDPSINALLYYNMLSDISSESRAMRIWANIRDNGNFVPEKEL